MAAARLRDFLPIDARLDEIVAGVRRARAMVVTAAPGAGKTTRVPPALAADGAVLLLQPRRVAARAIARRIAVEQGWTVGREVGWHVRLDRRFTAETRLLVATEGILAARLQQDPLLSTFRTIVVDEFHERSIHADVGLALARQAWLARTDLRLVVMSATIDAARVAAFLRDAPVVAVEGRQFPVEIVYRPGVPIEDAVAELLPQAGGAVLAFLPGAAEIHQAAARVAARTGGGVPVVALHGGLDAEAQDAALTPTGRPRVVLATNIAETTLTVSDVRAVVDAGLQKVARYDADRGVDSLEIERVSTDAADQRAGRAGRVAAGRAIRLWDSRDRLRPHRVPDVARTDLAAPALDVLVWGDDPRTFEWFETPPPGALDRALDLLRQLGAIDAGGRLTPLGRQLRRLPLHPRLARLLLTAGGAPQAARACALLSERHFLPASVGATNCDLLAAVDGVLPPHVERVARDIGETAAAILGSRPGAIADEAFRRAVLAGYPDRVGHRRAPGSDRFLLASGTGARLGRETGVLAHEFIVAVDLRAGVSRPGHPAADAIIRMATGIERDWIVPTIFEVDHVFDESTGCVRASRVGRYGEIPLRAAPVAPEPERQAALLAAAALRRGPSERDVQLLRRLAFAGKPTSFEALVEQASRGATGLNDMDLGAHVDPEARRAADRAAPLDLPLPSGRRARLAYRDDGRVVAAVKLQELFGLAETPRLGPHRTPVTFELLAPNGRPVQVTSDLASFWTTGYQTVRKALRARYPKHPWPDDPWTATPTHRTTKATRR